MLALPQRRAGTWDNSTLLLAFVLSEERERKKKKLFSSLSETTNQSSVDLTVTGDPFDEMKAFQWHFCSLKRNYKGLMWFSCPPKSLFDSNQIDKLLLSSWPSHCLSHIINFSINTLPLWGSPWFSDSLSSYRLKTQDDWGKGKLTVPTAELRDFWIFFLSRLKRLLDCRELTYFRKKSICLSICQPKHNFSKVQINSNRSVIYSSHVSIVHI